MKRQLINNNDNNDNNNNNNNSPSKRRKLNNSTTKQIEQLEQIDWTKMIPASSVRNYMLNDPLLDYLKEYKITSIDSIPQQSHR